ncbi:39S ribosomal protein L16, mitochondrial [Sitophilus oryzae]|uniref:Large ribosomal subunit protein uL16m n=1 Tax=Sitophilus oryzae TaxID=7048 RepID=A0A6J2XQC1_SITOR|nr:39S ribosomal protein L16, mitochondrial [Sitophilus oryzae]
MNIQKLLSLQRPTFCIVQICGIKNFKPPENFDHIEIPERPRLRYVDKVPTLPATVKPPKMQKRLRYMRGYEDIHNTLQLKQFGIIAEGGGRLKFGHFEVIRMTIGRKMDNTRMFALWRIDPPWQPVTKRGQGMRLGGGKGPIDHYVTPIKAGRVIVEMGGKCTFEEVEPFLSDIAMKMPFKAKAVSQEMLEEMEANEKWIEENNQNPYTMKYIIQNNIGGCHKWLSPVDFKYFGKHR